ncbi:uncharacterized protein YkwD [Thermodesulfitimonas autotrophica]|uniref:Uncharacterized protein YkwD n=1 Tax=Thermodesulfitimonas autotrophica TaxID=1894989 RepID=A0A3N5ANG5_9THEO|nr:CAP domain-containing protein [Thermodesulfitimonas autotrophica]RPF46619.1 uncharacterized protein YkwD [Thermodesulfitimonas autotrophica]
MRQKLFAHVSVLFAALVVALFLTAGAAHAYLSVSDYYAQWSRSGTAYPSLTTNTSVGNTNTSTVKPGVTVSSGSALPNATVVIMPVADRAGYYSRLLGETFPSVTAQPVPIPPASPSQNGPPENNGSTMPASSNPAPTSTGAVEALTAAEKEMLDLVNQERVKAGLHPFVLDMRLVQLARLKSQDMYQNHYFGHVSPTYGTAYDMEKRAGISARVMGGENIAKAATVARAHQLFMSSELHRANILDPRHDAIGIGIVTTPYGVYVTQLFIGD